MLGLSGILHDRGGAALQQFRRLRRNREPADLPAPLDEVEVHLAGRLADAIRLHQLAEAQGALRLHARLGLLGGFLAPYIRKLRFPLRERFLALALIRGNRVLSRLHRRLGPLLPLVGFLGLLLGDEACLEQLVPQVLHRARSIP